MPTIDPHELTGRRLLDVTASWYESHRGRDVRDPSPLSVWLNVEGLGWVQAFTRGAATDVGLRQGSPDPPVDMQDAGRVVVEHLPPSLALTSLIGEVITAVSGLHEATYGHPLGLLAHFGSRAAGLANLGDDLVVRSWPSPEWTAAGVVEVA